jgi:hypothetical protein
VKWPALLYPTFNSDSSIDSAFFAYAGELLRNGGIPYVSYWDHKPPLIHLINAAALTLSAGHVGGVWFANLAALLAALVLGYQALRRGFGVLGAMLGITFFAFSLPGILAVNLTEGYVLPIQWATVLLLVSWRSDDQKSRSLGFWLGVLGALGFLLRANLIGAAVSVALVLSMVLLSERRTRTWLRFVLGGIAGAILVGATVVAILALQGALEAFWDQVFHYNFLYAATSWKQRITAAYHGVERLRVYSPLVLPFAGWILAAYRLGKDRSHPRYAAYLLALVWLPIELLLASTSGRPYGHYFMTLFPPLSWLTAVVAAELVPTAAKGLSGARAVHSTRTVLALLVAVAILPVVYTARDLAATGLPKDRMQQVSPTVEYIRRHSGTNDKIFVWGHAADVYFFSGREPASRFIYPLPLLTPAYADSALIQSFLDELRTSVPSIIIDARGNAAAGEDLVPPLGRWDPEWRHPDPRQTEWKYESWWTMTPALKDFYGFVAENYVVADSVGPMKWAVYVRSPSSSAPPHR